MLTTFEPLIVTPRPFSSQFHDHIRQYFNPMTLWQWRHVVNWFCKKNPKQGPFVRLLPWLLKIRIQLLHGTVFDFWTENGKVYRITYTHHHPMRLQSFRGLCVYKWDNWVFLYSSTMEELLILQWVFFPSTSLSSVSRQKHAGFNPQISEGSSKASIGIFRGNQVEFFSQNNGQYSVFTPSVKTKLYLFTMQKIVAPIHPSFLLPHCFIVLRHQNFSLWGVFSEEGRCIGGGIN